MAIRHRIRTKDGHQEVSLGRKRAIRERCLNCHGWSIKAVRECPAGDCPLYPYRMDGGRNLKAGIRPKVIREYCLWCSDGSAREAGKCSVEDCPLWPYRQARVDRSLDLSPEAKKTRLRAA